MKKLVASTVLATALAVNFSGVGHAATMPNVSQEQVQKAKETAQQLLDKVSTLKADVKLKDAKYTVQYTEERGTVKVHIVKDSGSKKFEITDEKAKTQIVQFVKDLNLNKSMSKEAIIGKISKALGVKPSDVLKAKAAISFNNDADLSFGYKKGSKEAAESYLPNKLDVYLEGKKGEYFHAELALHDDTVKAKIEEKTSAGYKSYIGLAALMEMARLKSVLTPSKDTNISDYLTALTKELGFKPSELTEADVKAVFGDGSKADIQFSK
ncbi:hypothetical protein LRR81_15205 [Metabacillus sp. GX 13764]|uniref:YusW family protein n=1 Tax=Metabacillus kandeliae TaxID=2900151 RepID=UPI001E51CE5D|nr:hypothetical protein [Metabacillus kandeliae]MCD7035592.1 hypothetical protein [Metabacillus kandeliae]